MSEELISEEDRDIIAPYDKHARNLNAVQFAELFHGDMRLWGSGRFKHYIAVCVNGTDYLWNLKDGKYDGWDRSMKEAHEQK